MKHWDGRDRDHVTGLRLAQPGSARRRHQPAHAASVIGLALALGLLAGMALLLGPADPVSSSLVD